MTDLIPSHEGHPVSRTAVKITGKLITEDLEGVVLRQDDVVQVMAQFRVVGIHHDVEEKTGELVRTQILRPILMALVPIDPSDPADIGIIRSIVSGTP